MIRVLLADDHDLFRAGVRSLLNGFDGIEVVGEAGDGREAIKLAAALHPHVVLMDIMMPRMNGLDAAARIVATMPQTRAIIISMNSGEEFVLQALRSGAHGYLLKNTSPDALEEALRAVARGETYLCPAVSGPVIAAYLQRIGEPETPFQRLTTRQREVLQLIAEGKTSKAIANLLGLSTKTIEMYRTDLMKALDIHDIASLTRYAIRMGVVSPE